MSQVSSVDTTGSASNAVSQITDGTDKLKNGAKLDAVKWFFDIPPTRIPCTSVVCKVCQVSYKLQKKSYYNLELHCLKAHNNSWERVLAGGTLNESEGRVQSLLSDLVLGFYFSSNHPKKFYMALVSLVHPFLNSLSLALALRY